MSSVRHLERRRACFLPAILAASAVLTAPTLAYGDGVLPLGTEITDAIPPGVSQYYSYSTPVDGALTLTLGPTPGRNVQLGFAAPDQTLGAHGDAWGETYSVVVDNLRAGDYFAQLFLYGSSTEDPAAITLLATFEPALLDVDAEPNDEIAAALPLESGTQVTGHLGYDGFLSENGYDAQDFYAIEVLDGGTLDATLQMAAASANNALVLYDPSGATVQSLDITLPADQVTIHRDGLAGGTYYLLAHQYGFGHGSYSLEATVTDPTGGPDGDVVLPLETPLDDVIAGATEEYYSVTTPVDGSLTLTVYPPEGRNVQLGFAAPDKTLGVHGDSGGVEYSVTVPNLRAGSYYARLFTYGFTSDPPAAVTLLATFEPAPLIADAEPNDDPASALPLASFADPNGHLGYDGFTSDAGYDESDYFAIEVSDDGYLLATLRMEAASANNALQLLDAGQAVLWSQDITLPADQVTLRQEGMAGGTYYLKVLQYGFGYGAYHLAAEFGSPSDDPGGGGAGGETGAGGTGGTGGGAGEAIVPTTGGAGGGAGDATVQPTSGSGGEGGEGTSDAGSSADGDAAGAGGADGSAAGDGNDSVSAAGDDSGADSDDDATQDDGATPDADCSCRLGGTRDPGRGAPPLLGALALVGVAIGRRRRSRT